MFTKKIVRIILLIVFGGLTIIGFSLLSFTLLNSFQSQSMSQVLPKIIGLTILSIFSSISFSLVKAWNNIFNVFAKIIISISTILLGVVILIFVIINHSEDLTTSIQPTIDTLVIEYISNQTNPTTQMQIVQTIIEQPQTIVKLNAQNITSNEANKLIETLNVSTQKPVEISQILITLIDDYISTNQPQFENSPIPTTIISNQLQNFSNLPLDQLTMFLSYDPNATIYIMYPQNTTLEPTSNNLGYLRNQCEEIPQNLLCEQIESTSYSTIITQELSKTDTISPKTLSQINTTQKLHSFIISKANSFKYLLLFVILGIILAIICKEANEKFNKKEAKPSNISFFISSKLFYSMIFPTAMFVITYLFLTSSKFEQTLQKIISQTLQESFSISFQNLPLFLEFKEMLYSILLIYIIIILGIIITMVVSFYFLKKEKEKEKETKINHF